MGRFIHTRGRSSLALTHCDRCHVKMPVGDVGQDGDNPALMVCRDCYDHIDPWKLPPRKPDDYIIPGASPNDILLPEE